MKKKYNLLIFIGIMAVMAISIGGCESKNEGGKQGPEASVRRDVEPLILGVMDPLASDLACDCIAGYAQRDYRWLAGKLQAALKRDVKLYFSESLVDLYRMTGDKVDIVIGKDSVIQYDAATTATELTPILSLQNKEGVGTFRGLLVVKGDNPANSLADLNGKRIVFGLEKNIEKHRAAIEALNRAGVAVAKPVMMSPSCTNAALEVLEDRADAAAISDYAKALMQGCRVVSEGELKVIGQTEPVPFVAVYVNSALDETDQKAIKTALKGLERGEELLEKMESEGGFVDYPFELAGLAQGWRQWRGPGRDGRVARIPKQLEATPKVRWRIGMTGPGVGGLAVVGDKAIVPDKSEAEDEDVFRCLAMTDGKELWSVRYAASGEMDYTNSPRATPLVVQNRVYLLGAFGDLVCAGLQDGAIDWQINLVDTFGAELVTWGYSSSLMVVGDRLIVNPGAPDASIVALDRWNGELIWRCGGAAAAYGSFMAKKLGGNLQVVGYDAVTAGGWDVVTGKRLWTMRPDQENDFNVPTPLFLDDLMVLVTENNGCRIYAFDENGVLKEDPVAVNMDYKHDTVTPVWTGGRIFGCNGYNTLICLEDRHLKPIWEKEDEVFGDYASLIADDKRVLVVTVSGYAILIDAGADEYREEGRMQLYNERSDLYSHPALAGGALVIRNHQETICIDL